MILVKTIEATLPASIVDEVAHQLVRVKAYAMTTAEARRFGRLDRRREVTRGSVHELDSVPAVQVEVVVDDNLVRSIVATILKCARGRCADDGQVLVSGVSEVIRASFGRRSKPRTARTARGRSPR
jgi:nitrogen regulatory protein PII